MWEHSYISIHEFIPYYDYISYADNEYSTIVDDPVFFLFSVWWSEAAEGATPNWRTGMCHYSNFSFTRLYFSLNALVSLWGGIGACITEWVWFMVIRPPQQVWDKRIITRERWQRKGGRQKGIKWCGSERCVVKGGWDHFLLYNTKLSYVNQ